jgi:transposase
MASTRVRKNSRRQSLEFLQKPSGLVHPRVQQVGPEHFAVVSVDCAKARSKWMFADFYGKVLVPPTFVGHNRVELEAAVAQVRTAMQQYDIRDVLVAVERTGRYHHPVKNAFAVARFDTRLVHPYTSKQFRQPANPNNKTDDTDLAAIHRAGVNGFALKEAELAESWRQLQLLTRHRRSLVQKSSALRCQIRHHLDATLPGYAECFANLWARELAFPLVRQFGSAAAMLDAGLNGLARFLNEQRIRFHGRTLGTILEWARTAAAPDAAADMHRRIALAYEEDRQRKTLEILALERDIAHLLVRTPYLLLLSFPGINVVSAADFAAEMGPIENYANPRSITGRAGLFPSRYQSDRVDRVDRADGPLVRRGNRALRTAILAIADNLMLCNDHFKTLTLQWRAAGKNARWTHVKIGVRFCRIAYHMVAGRQVFRHPCLRERSYILDKVLAFHGEHETPIVDMMQDLNHALAHVPKREHATEARPLRERLEREQRRRRNGPRPLVEALTIVLARLGVGRIQSTESEESGETDLT